MLRQLGDFSQPLVGIEPAVWAALALAFASHGLGASGALRRTWERRAADLRGLGYAAIAAAAYLVGAESTRFIYFQF